VFTQRGTLGQVALVPHQRFDYYVLSQSQMKLTVDPSKADAKFLYYVFTTEEQQEYIRRNAIQTGVPHTNLDHLRKTLVRLPPLAEQRAIASILGTLDDKIELNRRMNETLEAMAQALFKSWFVDATKEGLPSGWREGTVDEQFNLTMGQSPPGESYNETGDGVAFYQGRTDFGFRYPAVRVFCTAPTRLANAGDTLVTVRAPVGSVNLAAEKCSVGRGVAAVRHKSGSRSYTYYLMRSLGPDFARFEADGTVFGSITKADFHALKRAAPPPALVEAFERLVFPIDQRIENNENESCTLAALRDALLPKLLAGELRVPAASRFTEVRG
jgi:type I restriction enzyme S subunit